jgi:uncharacterized protein YecE (DUF72 family)
VAERTYIGTAGWGIPRHSAHRFDAYGTHLQRYARRLRCAEINSSFHRPHSRATYARWAASVPPAFRFAVKVPRAITHERQLIDTGPLLAQFLAEASGLSTKLGPLLVQLPPSLAFERVVAAAFFGTIRSQHGGAIACEPRHPSWFTSEADILLVEHQVARVAADPARVPGAERPGGWDALIYLRLHGSPRTYWSPYAPERVDELLRPAQAAIRAQEVWCIFDNTASGAALADACALLSRIQGDS